jgi:hypothetical protein
MDSLVDAWNLGFTYERNCRVLDFFGKKGKFYDD